MPVTVATEADLDALRRIVDSQGLRISALEQGQPEPPPPPPPPQSGRWLSGAGVHDPYAFGAWRGRPLDVWETWGPQDTWANMKALPTIHQYFTGEGRAPFDKRWQGRLSFATPIWAKGEPPSKTASGQNDDNLHSLFSGLAQLGYGNAFLRLNWEHTGNWFYWYATDANTADWVKAFRRAHKIAKEVSPAFQPVWNPNKSSNYGYDARRSWPGDDIDFLVGVDWYNMYPATHTAAQWDAHYMQVDGNGAPWGLGAWAKFARERGRGLCLPEHGLDAGPGFNSQNGSGDDPHYMEKLHAFCSDPANGVVYESYFNLRGENFELWPATRFPRAAEAYKRLFGAAT